MALLNPVYGIIFPFLFVFTIPIAAFAAFTTVLAFSILLFRVTLIYVELAFSIIPHYLLGLTKNPKPLPRTKSLTSLGTVPGSRRRKRRSSTSSNLSGGTITPVLGDIPLGLNQSIGPTRDYEGVGGWRLGDPSDNEALWTNINSRLELPAHHERRHQRSLTSGSMPGDGKNRSLSPEAAMNSSRARTPPTYGTVFVEDGYFPQIPTAPRLKRSISGTTGASNSSASSKGSSVLSMKQR